MGRPLAKRFFGNENTDDTGFTKDTYQSNSAAGIGGDYVVSYTVTNAGSGWTTIPTVTFSGPTLPTGVSVAGTTHYKALSFTTTANGTGYKVGDVLEANTGTASTKARAPVSAIVTVGTPGITNGGSLYDLRGSQNDRIRFNHANLSTPLIVQVETVSGSTVTSISVVQAGVWTGSGAAPTSMANGVGGFTATTIAGIPGGDTNGNGLILSFPTNIWGVYSFDAVTVPGDYTAFPSTGASGTLDSITPATGAGAKATITMGLLSIAIDDPGSGYLTPTDAAISFSGSTGAAATAVMSDDSGTPYTADAFAALIPYAYTVGNNQIADIIRQRSSRRYYVQTAEGNAICGLVAGTPAAVGEMSLNATDDSGGTYYVIKLTAHKAVVIPNTGSTFTANTSVHWTLTTSDASYDATTTVVIDNA
jgi:hypothetical protein